MFIAITPETAAMSGKIYYVSNTGSDWTGSGTYSSPFKTIKKGLSKLVAGDTLCIRGGTYKEKLIINKLVGLQTAWITIRPYETEKVIIDASGLPGTYDGIFYLKEDCKFVRITCLELKNTKGHGIFLNGVGVSNIRIDHCIIHDCECSGIYCYDGNKNIEFDNNLVYYVNKGLSYGVSWSPQEAISFSNVQGGKIHHNILKTYGKEGIDCKSGTNNIEIYDNDICTSLGSPSFQWNYNHIGIYIDSFSRKNYNIKVYNNKIYGYGGAGIVFGSERDGGSLESIYIYNNSIDISYLSGHTQFRGIDSCYDRPMKDMKINSNTIKVLSLNHPIRIFPSAINIQGFIIKDNVISGKNSIPIYFQKLTTAQVKTEIIMSNNVYKRI